MKVIHSPKVQAPTDEIERLRSLFSKVNYESEGILSEVPVRGAFSRILEFLQARTQKKAIVERVGASSRANWPLGS